MISPAQLAALKPGDVLTVCVVVAPGSGVVDWNAGDAIKVGTGNRHCHMTFFVPLEQIDAWLAKGDGRQVPHFPPARDYLAALCGPHGRLAA